MTKNVLITGAGKGLGRSLVQEFHERGHRIFAIDIDPQLLKSFKDHKMISGFEADVSDLLSISNCCRELARMTDKIDLLINNAGIIDFFPLSECPPGRTKKVFDVNTFGPLNMINTFLPMLIKSQGLVINISSVSRNFPMAFQPYQPSKIAMEAIHRTVRQELMIKGIQMVLVRAGAIETYFLEHTRNMDEPENIPIFYNNFLNFRNLARDYIGKTVAAKDVAKKIYRISARKNPKYIYRINYNPLFALFTIMPERWLDRFIANKLKDRR